MSKKQGGPGNTRVTDTLYAVDYASADKPINMQIGQAGDVCVCGIWRAKRDFGIMSAFYHISTVVYRRWVMYLMCDYRYALSYPDSGH